MFCPAGLAMTAAAIMMIRAIENFIVAVGWKFEEIFGLEKQLELIPGKEECSEQVVVEGGQKRLYIIGSVGVLPPNELT